jgi:hypothetical protein
MNRLSHRPGTGWVHASFVLEPVAYAAERPWGLTLANDLVFPAEAVEKLVIISGGTGRVREYAFRPSQLRFESHGLLGDSRIVAGGLRGALGRLDGSQ